ncbi:hemerythrin domain-containing protein [Microvirga sp. VF16]|uniref:hemerythrin domain-containing protein n=1 Tax=Microvirga sp. VF16 TaxID=2807101 RepID=UPI00193CDA2D|nr:hemerythrin domain-containing protein [Microvirga sp. VF16]QRM28540.1 hemerythrin domain-containing protein [Microvirga sp. VF16]
MELWQMVVADHANIEELCREVLRATGSGPNSRAELFTDLQDELERHIAAQQNVLYPALSGHERTAAYLADLQGKQDEILRELDRLAARPDKNSADWAADFKDLTGSIRHAFTLEENGVMIVARSAFSPEELKHLWRRYERERIASYEAERWHMPQAMMPSRYGLPTGTVFGVLAGLAAIGAGALLWNATRSHRPRPRQTRPMRGEPWYPEPRPLSERGRFESDPDRFRRSAMRRSSPEARTYRTGGQQESTSGDDALLHGAGAMPPAAGGSPSDDTWFSSVHPPRAPSGISTPLQPGGTIPAGSTASSGAPQTGGVDSSGSPKQDAR